MKANTVRKSNMSKERVLALDELLPRKVSQYDSSPGVYVRSDRDRELDILWQGYRVNAREERSPLLYLSVGFVAGVISMLIMTAILNFGNHSKDSFADLDLWQKGNTKPQAVSVSPSADKNTANIETKAEYTVKSGDTLEKIAYKYYGKANPSLVNKIQTANNLSNPNQLKIDQKLLIPVEE
jgi:LysM repeat protein